MHYLSFGFLRSALVLLGRRVFLLVPVIHFWQLDLSLNGPFVASCLSIDRTLPGFEPDYWQVMLLT